ncbi:uncharacterized protein LOC130612071 [Hydractinia symbiolongicarpus]|uniref:uncharacterized protein LOC130612071 n=1 Tax=Hydractinia symbiolongicarpus TaxID=13093 RepID=UPI00254F1C6C|nr:uncharacterized protein LOC130612071 [Hydractinia symbiolongicarpus]
MKTEILFRFFSRQLTLMNWLHVLPVGPFSISSQLLALLKSEFAKPLLILINLSFSSGVFPCQLKIAKVIPVFKKGSKLDGTNYRPISLLSNIEKVKKLIYKRVTSQHDILSSQQFEFRRKHSTAHILWMH